ncbi:D-alanyl-D-alanine carboxypeptidase family protein [Paenibacillus senegalensis]|uniref:D-alanyl-D-alanine carboxypeptidase family protein n=1 Tax=Paenibacillus senegalensis TaxID=1465766 RepID=UPI000287BA5B|nr:D-alanyl-D-alanine carboxypeptidase family protein [Paenibacillus senegalensis]
MKKGLTWYQIMTRILTVSLIAVMILTSLPVQSHAQTAAPLELEANSAILMDASTGQVIYEMNADVALPPASMAKMMTEYIVMEKIKSGELKWDDMVTASRYAGSVIGSGGLLAEGDTHTVKDLFHSVTIYSGNDASVALAEKIAGTEENFAHMMNEKAREMGLSDEAHFINATGLNRADIGEFAPQGIEGETMLSARDSALLAYHILKDHKDVLEFTKIPRKKFRETDTSEMVNWNWMLEGFKDSVSLKSYAYEGLDGLKTGHTREAGYCFTGTAERNGVRLISVVMGTAGERERFVETRKLLDYGFNNFDKLTVYAEGDGLDELQSVKMSKGVKTTVPVEAGSELSLLIRKGADSEEIVKEAIPLPESELVAPIAKGDKVGTLKVSYDGQEFSIDIVAAEDNNKAGWMRLFFRGIKDFFINLGTGIKNLF